MEEFLNVGSIRIPVKWIFIGLGLLAAYVSMNIRLKQTELNNKLVIDTLFNALLYGFIVWKLSYALFNPAHAFAYPMGILYFDGGQKGMFLGLIVGAIYIHFQSTKQKMKGRSYVDLFLTGWLAGSATYFLYLLENHFFFYSGQILLALLLLFVIWRTEKGIGQIKDVMNIVLIYSLGQVFLHYFTTSPLFFLGFTLLQIVFAVISLFIILIQLKGGDHHR